MRGKTLGALLGVGAALGFSCARGVPVYNPGREVMHELPGGGGVYKQVWSNAEKLELSFYVLTAPGEKPLSITWTRYEPEDSGLCLKKDISIDMHVDAPEYGVVGEFNIYFKDNGCDGSVVLCGGIYSPDNGESVDISAVVCANPDRDFREMEEGMSRDVYNIREQERLWHERKGVEEESE